MALFDTMSIPREPSYTAPDGSHVRLLLELEAGGFAHFELPARTVSVAVMHRTVEEIWYVVGGRGEMWREQEGREEIVALEPGICLTIPAGAKFQLRSLGEDPLAAIAVTMPRWPGSQEAVEVQGKWTPTAPGQSPGTGVEMGDAHKGPDP